MAIGKAGAYATVEGPKVDFGDIALNAQKIQQADLDRMKDMIPKAEKEKEKEIKPLSIDEKTSTLGTFEDTSYKVAESAREGYYQAMKSGDPITASRFETVIKRLNVSKEIIKAGSDSFLKDFSEGKISGIESSKVETINNFRDRRNATGGVSANGTLYMQIFDKNENGDILMQDGKPVLKKIRVGDKLVNEITEDQLATYLVDYVKSNNILEESKKFAETTGAKKISDENGNVTIAKTEYTKQNLDLLKESISSKLKSDRKYFEDVWYQSNPSKNNFRKMPSEYTEEDYKEAENFLYNQTRRNFDTSYSKSYDEPKDTGNGNGDGDKDSPYLSPKVSVKQKKIKGVTSNYGYEIPVIQKTDKVKFGGVPVQIKSTGYDKDSKRFYIAYSVSTSESESSKLKPDPKDKTSTGGNKNISTKGSSVRYVWLNGEGANVTNGEILASNIKDLNGVNYNSVDDLITDIKTKDPKGMFFSNTSKGKGTSSQGDFNSKWAKLKSGQSLVGPDGKTYTKK